MTYTTINKSKTHSVELLFFIAFVIMLAMPGRLAGQTTLSIAFLQDGDNQRLDRERQTLTGEIKKVLGANYELQFPDSLTGIGTSDWQSVRQAYQSLPRNGYDYVVAVGPISSHLLSSRQTGRARIAPYVLDPARQHLPRSKDKSDVEELMYFSVTNSLGDHLEQLNRIAATDRPAILLDEQTREIFGDWSGKSDKQSAEGRLRPIFLDPDNPGALDTLSGGHTDGVVVGPFWNATSEQRQGIYRKLNSLGIPSIAMAGHWDVEKRNAPMAIYDEDLLSRKRARRTAMAIQEDLMGSQTGALSASLFPEQRLYINMEVIGRLGLRPDYALLNEAKLFNTAYKKIKESDILTLTESVRRALKNNEGLKQSQMNVEAQSQKVKRARSNLLPQLDAQAEGLLIDSDRAEAGFGTQPERTVDVGGTVSQILFSEEAWANYSIQKKLENVRRAALKGTRMDLILETAEAYITVLKAQKLKNIKQENVSVTRANLNRAKRRKETGMGHPGEVYRWEAKLANERQDLIKARTRLKLAGQHFNKLTGRPVEEEVHLNETPLSSPALMSSDSTFYSFIDDPWSFERFRSFMVEEGLKRAPAMKEVEEAIKARERALTSARLSYFLPEIGAQASYNYRIYKDGAGTDIGLKQELQQLPPTFSALSGLANSLPDIDDRFWNVGVKVTFPLFKGLEREADRIEAKQKLRALEHKRAEVKRKLEQQIRASLEQTSSSYTSIRLAEEAARAADKNLELVTSSYNQGMVSIQEVLDAQKTARQAKEAAATARYEFLLDVVKVQRATNHLDFFTSGEARQDWFNRLEAYMSSSQSQPMSPEFQ